jgi:hypothetical protein
MTGLLLSHPYHLIAMNLRLLSDLVAPRGIKSGQIFDLHNHSRICSEYGLVAQ